MAHQLINELNEFKRQFKDKVQAAIKAEFKAFFDNHAECESVVWTQYTPYFNDGDACTFRLNELEFHPGKGAVADDIAAALDASDVGRSGYGCGEYCLTKALRRVGETGVFGKNAAGRYEYDKSKCRPLTDAEKALASDAAGLSSLCHGLGEEMAAIFGDHVVVKATRDGFDIEEYDHD